MKNLVSPNRKQSSTFWAFRRREGGREGSKRRERQ
jgi:hypothetical protein